MQKRSIAILGATGSIGTQALDLVRRYPDRFEATCLVAGRSAEKLFDLVREFRPKVAALAVEPKELPDDVKFCQWIFGEDCPVRALEAARPDDALCAIVGIAGLDAAWTALDVCDRVLLANKEALVAGGHLVMEAARREGPNRLLPVDSEHSAIFQCLQGAGGNPYQSLVLTCSGGPFRTWDRQAIRSATRAQALKHPNWVMGQKITIDSATLFNKALEMMEARWLFDARPEQIQVVVHPQSVVHSGVTFADGALIAQLGTPDMRLPILYAMTYPERLPTGGQPLDLFSLSGLTFERPDEERFPSVRLSRECMQAGGAAGCVLNAANEEAVFHLLRSPEPVPIGRIFDTVEEVLSHVAHLPADTLDDVLAADRQARLAAWQYLSRF